ncbi:Hypothetical predicted protein [Pelobates cultripes]|uniref:Uncharacterized protein n=1 Tax=Pelobates cultripes TaxID=61616 RepID=A0AAD1SA07_PELCU|nr:Hypothetical predicted protein [Pelobates cultripes]
MNSEEFHSLLDATMSISVTQAIYTAMGVMSDNLSHSISSAIMPSGRASGPTPPMASDNKSMVPSDRKATSKSPLVTNFASKNVVMDRLCPVDIGQKRCGLGRGQKPCLIRPTLIQTQRRFQTGPMPSTQFTRRTLPPNAV